MCARCMCPIHRRRQTQKKKSAAVILPPACTCGLLRTALEIRLADYSKVRFRTTVATYAATAKETKAKPCRTGHARESRKLLCDKCGHTRKGECAHRVHFWTPTDGTRREEGIADFSDWR